MLRMAAIFFTLLQSDMLALLLALFSRIGFTMAMALMGKKVAALPRECWNRNKHISLVFIHSVDYKKRICNFTGCCTNQSLSSHMLRMASIFFTFLYSVMLALRSARSSRLGFTMGLKGKMAYSGMLASEIIGSRHRNENLRV